SVVDAARAAGAAVRGPHVRVRGRGYSVRRPRQRRLVRDGCRRRRHPLPEVAGRLMSQWAPPDATAVIPPAPVVQVDPNAIVAVTNVTKAFGDVVAVSDVSFAVGPGVTALLGPNGAGKSTLFRIMCGLTPPSQGTVRVLGADARRDREVRGRIGLAPQQDALFDRLTAHRFVEIAAETHALADPDAAARRALAHVEL